MFKFISFILVIGFMMAFENGNLLATETNDAEVHYFRGIEFGKAPKLKPNYVETQSAFKVGYTKKLKGDDDFQENTASVGYGCLGAYQGCMFGSTIALFVILWDSQKPHSRQIFKNPEATWIGGAILSAAAGGYLGSKAGATKPVLDDDGNVITAVEVKANMDSFYRKRYCIGGGILSAVPALIWGVLLIATICDCSIGCPEEFGYDGGSCLGFACCDSCSDSECSGLLVASTAVFELTAIISSYYIGKYYDQQRAINRIKAQRLKQKKHAFNEQEMADGFRLQLLNVTF
jgi:hypothetical protein